jgi:hypothetical protein
MNVKGSKCRVSLATWNAGHSSVTEGSGDILDLYAFIGQDEHSRTT